jgi:hypothetical protein
MKKENIVESAIDENKSNVQIYQLAVVSSISTLVYSEYIKNIKRKYKPKIMYMVPTIRSVQELLLPKNKFMQKIINELIDKMLDNDLFKKYLNHPELELFNDDNIEVLKVLLEYYIIPNIFKTVPGAIRRKFNIGKEDNQLFIEDNEIDLFERKEITDRQFDYIVEEIVIKLILMIESENIITDHPENNTHIYLSDNQIITIANDSAIAPISLNKNIIENDSVIDLLKFVTNTSIDKLESIYDITTGAFNQISVVTLNNYDNSGGN